MQDANHSDDPLKLHGLAPLETWRRLNPEQRAAGVGSLLLIVSTFGPFSFVEGAIIVAKAQRSTRALDRVEHELRTLVSHLE